MDRTGSATEAEDDPRRSEPEVDQAAADRLKRARKAAGFASALEFARVAGVNATTYHHHENGRRGISPAAAAKYARALRISAGSLLHGDQLHRISGIAIVGVISAGGRISTMDIATALNLPDSDPDRSASSLTDADVQQVHLPPAAQLEALVVVGNDLYPAYRDGDLVLTRRLAQYDIIPLHFNGVECVIERADGSRDLRQVIPQHDGRCTLIAYGRAPETNQRVIALAPVELVKKYNPHV